MFLPREKEKGQMGVDVSLEQLRPETRGKTKED